MFQAGDPHTASVTDDFGLLGLVVVVRIKDACVQAPTGPQLAPFNLLHRHLWISPIRLAAIETIERLAAPGPEAIWLSPESDTESNFVGTLIEDRPEHGHGP